MLKNTNKLPVILILLFSIALISFIFAPLYLDLRVMLASSNQVQYYNGNWFLSVLNTWELKGILNRFIIFLLYKSSTLITPFANSYFFEVINKLIYSTIVLGVLAFCSKILKPKNIFLTFVFLGLPIFSAFLETHMQAEMHVCIILILAFSIYLNILKNQKNKNLKLFFIGVLLGSIFFIKSILIVLSLGFFATILLHNKSQKIKSSFNEILVIISGMLFSLLLGFVLILKYAPDEIQNMLNASKYQKSLFASAKVDLIYGLKYFYRQFTICAFSIPVIFLGICAFISNFVSNIRQKDFKSAALRFFVLFITGIIILIANRFFKYHYLIFVPFMMYEISRLKIPEIKLPYLNTILLLSTIFIFGKIDIAPKVIVLFFSLYLLICLITNFTKFENIKLLLNFKIPLVISGAIFLGYISIFTNNFLMSINSTKYMYSYNSKILKKLDLKNKEKVLYLDFGYGAYFLKNPSYLKEYNCLCIQRLHDLNAIKQVLDYKGRYIVLYSDWILNEQKNEEILEKVRKQYHRKEKLLTTPLFENIFLIKRQDILLRFWVYERN